MIRFEPGLELAPEQRLVLALDTPDISIADETARLAKKAGAVLVKVGLELLTSPNLSLRMCSEMVADNDLEWVADPKLYATLKTMPVAVKNYLELLHPPSGITISTHSGLDSLSWAQQKLAEKGIMIFGVAHLSTIDDSETLRYERTSSKSYIRNQANKVIDAGVKGMVCSGEEVYDVKKLGLFTLVVGTRSQGVTINGDDQKRITTRYEAISNDADLLEIGREVTNKQSQTEKLEALKLAADEVRRGLDR